MRGKNEKMKRNSRVSTGDEVSHIHGTATRENHCNNPHNNHRGRSNERRFCNDSNSTRTSETSSSSSTSSSPSQHAHDCRNEGKRNDDEYHGTPHSRNEEVSRGKIQNRITPRECAKKNERGKRTREREVSESRSSSSPSERRKKTTMKQEHRATMRGNGRSERYEHESVNLDHERGRSSHRGTFMEQENWHPRSTEGREGGRETCYFKRWTRDSSISPLQKSHEVHKKESKAKKREHNIKHSNGREMKVFAELSARRESSSSSSEVVAPVKVEAKFQKYSNGTREGEVKYKRGSLEVDVHGTRVAPRTSTSLSPPSERERRERESTSEYSRNDSSASTRNVRMRNHNNHRANMNQRNNNAKKWETPSIHPTTFIPGIPTLPRSEGKYCTHWDHASIAATSTCNGTTSTNGATSHSSEKESTPQAHVQRIRVETAKVNAVPQRRSIISSTGSTSRSIQIQTPPAASSKRTGTTSPTFRAKGFTPGAMNENHRISSKECSNITSKSSSTRNEKLQHLRRNEVPKIIQVKKNEGTITGKKHKASTATAALRSPTECQRIRPSPPSLPDRDEVTGCCHTEELEGGAAPLPPTPWLPYSSDRIASVRLVYSIESPPQPTNEEDIPLSTPSLKHHRCMLRVKGILRCWYPNGSYKLKKRNISVYAVRPYYIADLPAVRYHNAKDGEVVLVTGSAASLLMTSNGHTNSGGYQRGKQHHYQVNGLQLLLDDECKPHESYGVRDGGYRLVTHGEYELFLHYDLRDEVTRHPERRYDLAVKMGRAYYLVAVNVGISSPKGQLAVDI